MKWFHLANSPSVCIFNISVTYGIKQVVAARPPSDKIGVKSVQRETEEIIPMKEMKMAWFPYIPLEDRYLLFVPMLQMVFRFSA